MTRVICPQCGAGGASGRDSEPPAQGYNCHMCHSADKEVKMVRYDDARSLAFSSGERAHLVEAYGLAAIGEATEDRLKALREDPVALRKIAVYAGQDAAATYPTRESLWLAEAFVVERGQAEKLGLKVFHARPADKDEALRLFRQCRLNGYPFVEGFPLQKTLVGPGFASQSLWVPEGTPLEVCAAAGRTYAQKHASTRVTFCLNGSRAVASEKHPVTRIVFCPGAWFEEAGLALPSSISQVEEDKSSLKAKHGSMKLNRSPASGEGKEATLRTLRWCKQHGGFLNGLPYDDPLAGPDGIDLILLVPKGAPDALCESALRQGYSERDIVSHRVLECPVAWFEEAGLSACVRAIETKPVSDNEGPGL